MSLGLHGRRPWRVWVEPAGRREAPGVSPAAAPASRAGGVWHFTRVSWCGRASERRSERSRVVDASLAGRRTRCARKCRCGRARRWAAHCGVTWSCIATRLLWAWRGRGPWAADWAYIHGFFCMVGSSDFGVTGGAALAFSSRGSSWWLGARWLAVGGGIGRWRAAERTCVFLALWRRACCGAYPLFIARARFEFSRFRVFIASFGRRGRPSPLRLRVTRCRFRLRPYRRAAASVLRCLPAFYRSGAFCAFPAFF